MSSLKERVEELERRVRELEARPPMIVYPPIVLPMPQPTPYPHFPSPFIPTWTGPTTAEPFPPAMAPILTC
jgi:hypothetical protein